MLPLLALSLVSALGPSTVEWDAPAACPSADHVERRITELASDPRSVIPTGALVRGHVRRVDGRWRLSLEIHGPRGTEHRTLEADDCYDLADAAALMAIAALETNPAAAASSTPAASASAAPVHESSGAAPIERAPTPPHTDTPRPPPQTRELAARSTIRAIARVGAGRVAGSDLSILFGAGALWRRARIDLWVAGFVPGVAGHPVRDAHAIMTLGTLGIRAGPRWARGRVAFALCGAVEGGPVSMRGRGAAVDRPRDDWTGWLGIGAQAAFTWRASRHVALVAEAEVFGAVVRPQARVGGEPPFWSAPWVSGGAGVGVQVGPFGHGRRSR